MNDLTLLPKLFKLLFDYIWPALSRCDIVATGRRAQMTVTELIDVNQTNNILNIA